MQFQSAVRVVLGWHITLAAVAFCALSVHHGTSAPTELAQTTGLQWSANLSLSGQWLDQQFNGALQQWGVLAGLPDALGETSKPLETLG